MPYVGKRMDRKRNEHRRRYRETIYCETHKRTLDKCRYGDATCAVCGCGGLCDSKTPCPMERRPLP